MATTSDGIWTPDSVDTFALVNDLAAMAASIQAALNKRANHYTGTTTQRTAVTTSAPEGTLWSDTNGEKILWIKQGASWQKVWPVDDTGWTPLTPEPGWTIPSAATYRGLSARRVGSEVWIEGMARLGGTIPAGFIATLPASIPPPPRRTPLLDHRPERGQGEVTLGDAEGGNLNRVYNFDSRGSNPIVVLSGHYFID